MILGGSRYHTIKELGREDHLFFHLGASFLNLEVSVSNPKNRAEAKDFQFRTLG